MLTHVRTRTIKAGKFQSAIRFLKEYKAFVESELDQKMQLGVELGKLGTIVSAVRFDNAQAWEDGLNKLRSSDNYAAILDQSAEFFEDEVVEHLISDIPD